MPMITAGFLQWCNVYSFSKPVPSLSNGGKKRADFQRANSWVLPHADNYSSVGASNK